MTNRVPALLVLAAIAACTQARIESRDTLRRIVQDRCVPGQAQTGQPAPCVEVDAARGYAVLKDRDGVAQYLLLPTARVTGIEDPSLRDASHPDYFAYAWTARHYAEAALGQALPRQDIALAVNSRPGRSQDQLHIHIDCLRADIRDELGAHAGDVTASWGEFPEALSGHHYLARRIEAETLEGIDPFALLAAGVQGAAGDMKDYTLVVAGSLSEDGKPDFILLADHADHAAGDRASGEELLDHACAVAR